MIEQVQETMTSVEQYRMAMNIIRMWETYRTPILYIFGALLVLTILLYIMKNCWKHVLLMVTIITGVVIVGLDGFKMYVAHKRKEAIKSLVTTAVEQIIETKTEEVPLVK